MLAAATLTVLLAQFGQAGDNSCPAPCVEEVCKKVCVPTVENVKKTTPAYRMKCEDLCLPKCGLGLFSRFRKSKCDECGDCGECGDCASGDCAQCGKPREVRRLVKKFNVEEECKVKCVVEHRMETVPVKCKKVECAVECAPAPCAPAACCAPACERAPLFQKKQKFCCPDYSNPYAGTPLDPNAAPAKAEKIPAPKKEEAKPEPKGAALSLPLPASELQLDGQQ